jgi:hypothetical protein
VFAVQEAEGAGDGVANLNGMMIGAGTARISEVTLDRRPPLRSAHLT